MTSELAIGDVYHEVTMNTKSDLPGKNFVVFVSS